LKENPEAGKPVEEALPFRDLLISFGSGNYMLRYREENGHVLIVRVRHSKEERF
jgi:plasmid stabilization system protein ParE